MIGITVYIGFYLVVGLISANMLKLLRQPVWARYLALVFWPSVVCILLIYAIINFFNFIRNTFQTFED
jgi:hypothetical protein